MTEKIKKRSLVAEQLGTVKKAFITNDIDLKDIDAGLTLYKSLIRAKERAGKRKGYEHVKFLFKADPRHALIQIIKELPEFWNEWKEQQLKYAESGYNDNYRGSIHRLDATGNYELSNISVVPYGEHLKENAVVTGFFGVKDGKQYFEYFHSITEASEFFGINSNILKRIENQKVEINGFVGMYSRIEQRPSLPKEEQDKRDKENYQDTLKRIELLESITSYKVHPDTFAMLYKQKELYERFGWHLL